jgi:hypothetical protein
MTAFAVEWAVADSSGALIGTILGSGGTLSWDANATIQRVVRGTQFEISDWNQLDKLNDWLVPIFRRSDGTSLRLGMFSIASDPARYLANNLRAPVEPYLVDGGSFLATPSPYNLSGRSAESVSDALERVCDAAGIERRMIEPTGEIFGEPVAYQVGTTFATALNGFCSLAGFLPPHFDRNGILQLRPLLPDDAQPAAFYDSTNILYDTRVEDSDYLDAPNVFVVVGSGATDAPIIATAEIPVNAPNSLFKRNGRRIAQIIREQGIESVAQAQRLVQLIANTAVAGYQTISFGAVPNPNHDCFDLVSVNNVIYREMSWDFDMTIGGVMSHRVASELRI